MIVEFDIGFEQPPTDDIGGTALTYGGIRVTINGEELTKWNDQEIRNEKHGNRPRYDYQGNRLEEEFYNYKGRFIAPIILKLLNTLIQIQSEEGRFSEKTVELTGPGGDVLVFSYLDGTKVRLAFQKKHDRNQHSSYPPLSSLLGYSINCHSLCKEVIEIAENYLTYSKLAGHSGSTNGEIGRKIEKLKTLSSS